MLTTGSPMGLVDGFPSSAQVLSLENTHDPVPDADHAGNPPDASWTTVRFDGASAEAEASGSGTYTAGGRAVDATSDVSVPAVR